MKKAEVKNKNLEIFLKNLNINDVILNYYKKLYEQQKGLNQKLIHDRYENCNRESSEINSFFYKMDQFLCNLNQCDAKNFSLPLLLNEINFLIESGIDFLQRNKSFSVLSQTIQTDFRKFTEKTKNGKNNLILISHLTLFKVLECKIVGNTEEIQFGINKKKKLQTIIKKNNKQPNSSEIKEKNEKEKFGKKNEFNELNEDIQRLMTKESKEMIEDNNTLLILQKSQNISETIRTQEYAKEYKNKEIIDKIMTLSEEFPHYRQIRGDGNCFFRAFGFLFLENLFVQPFDKKTFKQHPIFLFIEEIKNKDFSLKQMDDSQDAKLIPILKKIKNLKEALLNNIYFLILEKVALDSSNEFNSSQKNSHFKQKIFKLFNEKPLFDMALVLYIRSMIFKFFIENQTNEEYMPFFFDFEEKMLILTKYGEEADNTIIPMTGLAFKKRIIINMLHTDPKKKQTIILKQKYPENDDKTLQDYNFFFRPGHYDIFYEKDYIF